MVGSTISHYKVTGELGRGGMGVVYKAEDTKLKRPVALKFLAAHLLDDEEIKTRFHREAEAAAALNHPNVCTVHEIAEANGRTFIAMAFLEGEPLEKKIEAGPLKLKDALDIAIQTAKGLQAAHGKKIVHRDIKPANLMIGEDGHVTIMDFGLALLTDRSKLTRLDETMGTVTYMSPEQTYGMELDHRTDVWSLGVVIYEMVTGQRPFKGHYDKAVMYSITNEEPEPMTALRTGVPMELELLVNKCLAKEADRRYQSTADMVVDLETLSEKLKSGKSAILTPQAASQTGAAPPAAAVPPSPGPLARYRVIEDVEAAEGSIKYLAEDTELHRSVAIRVLPQSSEQQIERAQRRKQAIAFGAGGLGVLLALIFAVLWLSPTHTATEAPLRRFAFTPPEALSPGVYTATVAISPDGKRIAYVAGGVGGRKLWVQDLDQRRPRVIEGTARPDSPFWSPDSNFIGFAAEGELRKVSQAGGLAIRLCELPSSHFHGGSWSPDGESIVFSSGEPHSLYEVPARGGAPSLLLSPDDLENEPIEERLLWPHFLPSQSGERVLLFSSGPYSGPEILVADLEDGRQKRIGLGAFPIYSPSGHIVYQSSAQTYDLWALPFAEATFEATGEAFPVSENSAYATVAADQTMVYLEAGNSVQQGLIWLDRNGERVGEVGQAEGRVDQPALSPDGKLVAVMAGDDNRDIWVWDVGRGVQTRLSASPARDEVPVWSPSGDQIAFSSNRAGNFDIYVRKADGSGEPQALTDTPTGERISDWSRDGQYILYDVVLNAESGRDLGYLKRSEGGEWESRMFLQTPFNQLVPKISPDGRYIAYVSNESGQPQVYVQPFPGGGRKTTVSAAGGLQPRWSHDGKELFYLQDMTLMVASVSTGTTFEVDSTRRLFDDPLLIGLGFTTLTGVLRYDVSLDGQRFIVAGPMGDQVAAPVISVVQNWYEEFRDHEQD